MTNITKAEREFMKKKKDLPSCIELGPNDILATITKEYLLITLNGQSYRRPLNLHQLLGLNVATAKALAEKIRETAHDEKE